MEMPNVTVRPVRYALFDPGGREVDYPGYHRAEVGGDRVVTFPRCEFGTPRSVLVSGWAGPDGVVRPIWPQIYVSAGVTPQLRIH